MSALRLGRLPDGRRHIILLEPARARVTGHGGAVAGYWAGTIVQPAVKPSPKPDRPRAEDFEERASHYIHRGLCMAPLRGGGFCYRRQGHGEFKGASRWAIAHSSQEAMEQRARKRRVGA